MLLTTNCSYSSQEHALIANWGQINILVYWNHFAAHSDNEEKSLKEEK